MPTTATWTAPHRSTCTTFPPMGGHGSPSGSAAQNLSKRCCAVCPALLLRHHDFQSILSPGNIFEPFVDLRDLLGGGRWFRTSRPAQRAKQPFHQNGSRSLVCSGCRRYCRARNPVWAWVRAFRRLDEDMIRSPTRNWNQLPLCQNRICAMD